MKKINLKIKLNRACWGEKYFYCNSQYFFISLYLYHLNKGDLRHKEHYNR